MREVNGEQVLDTPMTTSDVRSVRTIRDFLIALLSALWTEQEGFSGKRPFGNSGWEYEVYVALIKAGYIKGVLDEDGYVENVDTKRADALVHSAIRELGAHK